MGILQLLARLVATTTGREPTGIEARMRGQMLRQLNSAGGLKVGPQVHFVCPERMEFGRDVTIWGHAVLNASGNTGHLRIGDKTHIDHFAVLYAQGGLAIGRACAIAAGVTVYTQTNQYDAVEGLDVVRQPVRYEPVSIGDDVWLGARAIVLPGVEIGDHAVVAAGAVVLDSVRPGTIVAGVPARVVRQRSLVRKGRAE